jgi:hypothetical protein
MPFHTAEAAAKRVIGSTIHRGPDLAEPVTQPAP